MNDISPGPPNATESTHSPPGEIRTGFGVSPSKCHTGLPVLCTCSPAINNFSTRAGNRWIRFALTVTYATRPSTPASTPVIHSPSAPDDHRHFSFHVCVSKMRIPDDHATNKVASWFTKSDLNHLDAVSSPLCCSNGVRVASIVRGGRILRRVTFRKFTFHAANTSCCREILAGRNCAAFPIRAGRVRRRWRLSIKPPAP
jgi:hypothetical protein